MERLAVYAGSFDPLTNGHLWMIKQGAQLFDKLIVAIGINPDKQSMFTPHERLDMLVAATSHFPNILTEMFTNQYLINYARGVQCRFILRGIRNESDYTYERGMRNINGDLGSGVTTVFLMPPRDIAEVSSSMVKGLVGPQGWEKVVEKYVPPIVLEKLKEKHNATKSV
jgi:pantetheine-phosphate adenylyltransferase